jgi:TatD DNase family protein
MSLRRSASVLRSLSRLKYLQNPKISFSSINTNPNMAKKKSNVPPEHNLLLPTPPSSLAIIDTHTHLASTFAFYRRYYKDGKYNDVFEFIRSIYEGRNVESIVDVWCEAPVQKSWKTFADSALNPEDRETIWGGMNYWFVIG